MILKKANSLLKMIKLKAFWFLSQIAKYSVLCSFFKNGRVSIWRLIGANIGKGVYIGWDVYFDVSNANLITLEDDVTITSRVLILCHRRDMKGYVKGSRYNDLPYFKASTIIKKGASIGMSSVLMPGVTIGEGAIVGSGSVVVKDVPAWSIVAGNPARVIKQLEK